MATASDGDFIILWAGYTSIAGIALSAGTITNNRFGSFHHDDLIGTTFGTKVRPRKGGDKWVAVLRPSPEMITQSLVHRTQIIYHADISLLVALLDVRPGKIICEAGTGSGSVSTSLARAVSPGGRLHTFEYHADRQRQAVEDFTRYGIQNAIVSRHGDVCADGFGADLDGQVNGIFLDLPMPWVAIPHADRCLVEGGRVCCFSPCIEQIEKTAAELRRGGRYYDVRMFETLAVNWGVKPASRPQKRKRGADVPAAAPVVASASASPAAPRAVPPAAALNAPSDAEAKTAGLGGDAPTAADDGVSEPLTSAALEAGAGTWISYQMPMRSHTGYLLAATRAPDDEQDVVA